MSLMWWSVPVWIWLWCYPHQIKTFFLDHGIKNMQSSWSQQKEEIHRLFQCLANTKLTSHILRGLRVKRLLLYYNPAKNFHREMREAPHLLESRMLQITVFLRRMEYSDFMSILARSMHLNDLLHHITVIKLPGCRAWLSLHPLFSGYPLLGAYLLTTCTYKHMHLLTRVYNTIVQESLLSNHKTACWSSYHLVYSISATCTLLYNLNSVGVDKHYPYNEEYSMVVPWLFSRATIL